MHKTCPILKIHEFEGKRKLVKFSFMFSLRLPSDVDHFTY
jgi:hypothetical protein